MIQKMKDQRFRKTEEKILAVFLDGDFDTMGQIAKKIGVARSTVYTHHHTIREILSDWEEYILVEYFSRMKKDAKNIDMRILFFEILVFILQNQKFFEVFLKLKDRKIIVEMISSVQVNENSKKIFRIWVGEIVEVIFEWGERGFPKNDLGKLVSDIMYLTRTMHDRLLPLCG